MIFQSEVSLSFKRGTPTVSQTDQSQALVFLGDSTDWPWQHFPTVYLLHPYSLTASDSDSTSFALCDISRLLTFFLTTLHGSFHGRDADLEDKSSTRYICTTDLCLSLFSFFYEMSCKTWGIVGRDPTNRRVQGHLSASHIGVWLWEDTTAFWSDDLLHDGIFF